MLTFQRQFIEHALACRVLCFGRYTLKSGRVSPYFFNIAGFDSGASLARLGQYYAEAISAAQLDFDMLYGPAYKGIPLASAVAIAFALRVHRDLPYCFNRKEAKDHGEGGNIFGAPLRGRVLIVDDVVSAGTSVAESVEVIRAAGAVPVGVAVALDRMERGRGEATATEELSRTLGLRICSIITMQDLLEYLGATPDYRDALQRIRAYLATYGDGKRAW